MDASWDAVLLFLAFTNFFSSIVAVIGNSLTINALRRNRSLHSPTKALLFCLALTDFGVGFFVQPVFAIFTFVKAKKVQDVLDAMDDFGILIMAPGFTLCFVSLWTLTAISIDRFLALHLGQRYREVVTLRRIVPLLISFWIIGALHSLLLYWSQPSLIKIWSLTSIICILVSTFSFTKVYVKLRQQQVQIHNNVDENANGNMNLNMARYKKSVNNMICVYLLFVMCYVPHACLTTVLRWSTGTMYTSNVLHITSNIIYINSSLNPLVYCWRIREIRQIVWQSFCSLCQNL